VTGQGKRIKTRKEKRPRSTEIHSPKKSEKEGTPTGGKCAAYHPTQGGKKRSRDGEKESSGEVPEGSCSIVNLLPEEKNRGKKRTVGKELTSLDNQL